MIEEYRHTKTTVSLLNYHFVFCPRYRRKIFLNEAVDLRFKQLVQKICEKYGFKIVAMKTDKDHCHLIVNTLPTFSPADVMNKVKGGTSKILREEFAHLNKMPSLWTRNYFVSTAGNVSSETIKRYVEMQRKR
ncbi:IS200/IS605 family transposase [Lederbergia ruris]|uniref:IS200/IS605 family transposase n=1 Tax=Lederbergia ruris TaxID=217495 RepID=UPI001BB37784|nr:IS200/IS605 family transposase [Lederbergia ruris]